MNAKKHDVLVVGELNIDLILNDIEKFPEIGKEVIANQMKQTLGSSSAILANNLSVLGSKVTFLGKVGYDSYAAQVSATLKRANVDISNILKTSSFLTGITVAFNFGNDRAMITYPGAMNDLGLSDIPDEVLLTASHLHVSSIFLQQKLKPDIAELFRRARKLGLTTSLDPQWDPDEKWDIDLKSLLPYVSVFLPNETEMQRLTRTGKVSDAIEKIKEYSNQVVVKCGVHGCIAWNGTDVVAQPAYLNEHVVDAIGAGDSFNAGFLNRFIQKKPFAECLNFGALTGAVNTTSAGGTGAFPSYEKVMETINKKFLKHA
jgi:sugar/nucleoside kinase (ribokinase family)